MSARQVIISHCDAEGTLVEGIGRADRDLHQVMKTHRLRYAHDLGQWYLPRSCGRAPGLLAIDRLADALRKAGCEVTVKVDATPAGGAEREQARAERVGARQDALEAKAARLDQRSAAAWQRYREMAEEFPLGQPVLDDHYSAGRDRRHRERMRAAFDHAVQDGDAARAAAGRAETSRRAEARQASPPQVRKRIAALEAAQRKLRRELDGDVERAVGVEAEPTDGRHAEQLHTGLAHVEADLAWWRAVLAQHVAEGFRVCGPADFRTGDRVRIKGGDVGTVVRVNPKTLTVDTGLLPWPLRYPYADVEPVQPAERGQ